jgi:hypothetical protein
MPYLPSGLFPSGFLTNTLLGTLCYVHVTSVIHPNKNVLPLLIYCCSVCACNVHVPKVNGKGIQSDVRFITCRLKYEIQTCDSILFLAVATTCA